MVGVEELEQQFGVILQNRETGKKLEAWFSTEHERERYLKTFCKNSYEILEYVSEQLGFNFDVR